jgi:hypothetical protein
MLSHACRFTRKFVTSSRLQASPEFHADFQSRNSRSAQQHRNSVHLGTQVPPFHTKTRRLWPDRLRNMFADDARHSVKALVPLLRAHRQEAAPRPPGPTKMNRIVGECAPHLGPSTPSNNLVDLVVLAQSAPHVFMSALRWQEELHGRAKR